MSESNFRKRVLKFLKPYEIEGKLVVITVQNVSVRGISDILLCVKGRFWAVELKAETGRPSELQTRFLERIRVAGGRGILLYPALFETFKKEIEEATK